MNGQINCKDNYAASVKRIMPCGASKQKLRLAIILETICNLLPVLRATNA